MDVPSTLPATSISPTGALTPSAASTRIPGLSQPAPAVAGSGRQGYSGDGGPATEATLDNLYSLDVDTNGDIYIVDRLNAAIRKVDAATGIITTVAGTGVPGYSGDGGPGVLAQLREPNDCLLDWRSRLTI